MKSTPLSSHKLDLRLAAYAAAGVALAAPAMSPSARADIVYSGPLTLSLPNDSNGIYLDLVTGATATAFFTGCDINPYSSGGGLILSRETGTSFAAATSGAAPSALAFGATIAPTSPFTNSSNATNFKVTGTEYLGLLFINTNTGATDYGWIQFQTTATTGYPGTILGYAYNNVAGGSILAGQISAVPEPGTTAALGLGALSLGAAGIRRWRKSKQAVA